MTAPLTSAPALSPEAVRARVDSVRLLLADHGHNVERRELVEELRGHLHPEALCRSLEARGLAARVVRFSASELHFLASPSVCFLKDGSAAIFHGMQRDEAVFERCDGEVRILSTGQLKQRLGSDAIEVTAPPLRAANTAELSRALLSRGRRHLLTAFGVSVGMAALGIIAPLSTQVVVDHALPYGASQTLVAATIAVAAGSVHRAWLSWLREKAIRGLDGIVQSGLLQTTFRRILRAPFATSQRVSVGDQLQSISSGRAVVERLSAGVLSAILDLVPGLIFLVALAVVTPGFGVAATVAVLFAAWISVALAKRQAQLLAVELEHRAQESGYLHEVLAGVTTLKSTRSIGSASAGWLQRLIPTRSHALTREYSQSLARTLMGATREGLVFSSVVVGSYATIDGRMSVGALVLMHMLAAGVGGAIVHASEATFALFSVTPHLERIAKIVSQDERVGTNGTGHPPKLSSADDAIVLEDVWFRYGPDLPWVLKGYSLRVKVRDLHTLRSPSGTGKSTILRLIAGLYEPERGVISVMGRSPRQANHLIAYLPQRAHLFAGSIDHNLRLLADVTRREVADAARRTGLSEWLRTLPMGPETVLPPGAPNLSGGQRQWICFTAAVASKRPILLLDEGLSQLDVMTRKRLRDAQLLDGKTVLSVSHDV